MNPTLTDDALVHHLRERADALVPPMGLDTNAVLVAGRRYRRWRAAARTAVGVAGVAVVALGATQLTGDLRGDGVPAVAQLVTVGDFTVVAATDLVPVDEDAELRTGTLETPGSLFDTGVAVDPADPEGARWVLEHVVLSPEDVAGLGVTLLDEEGDALEPGETDGQLITNFLAARSYDPRTGELGERFPGGSAVRGEGLDETAGMNWETDGTQALFGLAERGYTPHLYLTGPLMDVPAEESRVLVPTFALPGVDGPVYFVRVAGDQPWPYLTFHPAQYVTHHVTGDRPAEPWGR